MGRLQGQNFRLGTLTGSTFQVYGMATSCSITRGTQTDDASTKDDAGLSSKPTVTSKNTQVRVESLQVTDMASLLTAVKSMQPITIMWDETATSDNQTAQKAVFARKLSAYLSDATFTFNDRENSAKSLQFVGTGPVEPVAGNITTNVVGAGSYTKGQFVRLFLSDTENPSLVVSAAKQLSFHVSVSLENATTKDTEGDYEVQEPTGITYDITSNALVRSSDVITSSVDGHTFATLEEHYESEDVMYWEIANVSGANQRTKGSVIVSGRCIISQLEANSPNKQSADYTSTLNGYGDFVVGV